MAGTYRELSLSVAATHTSHQECAYLKDWKWNHFIWRHNKCCWINLFGFEAYTHTPWKWGNMVHEGDGPLTLILVNLRSQESVTSCLTISSTRSDIHCMEPQVLSKKDFATSSHFTELRRWTGAKPHPLLSQLTCLRMETPRCFFR